MCYFYGCKSQAVITEVRSEQMTKEEKSVQDLEKEKLEIEIALLKKDLEKEKKEKLDRKSIGEIIRKNIALLLAIISVVGGLWGIILPINQYYKEKRKEMLPNINSDIINLVNKLNDTSEIVQEEATVMLSYYGLNAIPILLLRLEISTNEVESQHLIITINNIYKNDRSAVLNEIINSFKSEFYQYYQKTDMDEIPYFFRIYNYRELFLKLDLDRRGRNKVDDMIRLFEEELSQAANDEFVSFFSEDLNAICAEFEIDSVRMTN